MKNIIIDGKTYKLTPIEEVGEYPKILEFESVLTGTKYSINKDNRYVVDGLGECSHSFDSMLHVERCVDSGDIIITKVAKDDDTVLAIGDNTNVGTIVKFEFLSDKVIFVKVDSGNNYNLTHVCHKANQPLFTTSDGVPIFENTPYYSVNKKTFTLAGYGTAQHGGDAANDKGWITFSRYEQAEQWIHENKPEFSREQIKDAIIFAENHFGTHIENIYKYLNL